MGWKKKAKALGHLFAACLLVFSAFSLAPFSATQSAARHSVQEVIPGFEGNEEELRLRYIERYRPQFHFSPERGWLNDPNGMVYYNGEYHLFYQYHPAGKTWGPMHWGHAVSTDLVRWEHLPIALYPDHLGTIFSGSAVVDWHDTSGFFGGQPGLVAIFTHSEVQGQIQSIAYSADGGRTWQKYAGNPVLTQFRNEDYRDPKVFWYEDTEEWIMVVGGGKVRIYSSPNLRDWTLTSEIDIWTECPDLFPLPVDGNPDNMKWVLSLGGRGYYIGAFDGVRFIPESEALPMNYGPDAYAAQTFSDEPNGRRIMLNWMNNWEYANSLANITDPWNGAMTLPYELSLKTYPEGIRLVQQPIPELQSLRRRHLRFANETIQPGTNLLADVRGAQLEIIAEFELGTATEFGFKVRTGDGEETVVGYKTADHVLFVDRDRSGVAVSGVYEAPLAPENNRVKLHLFVDWSSLEVFGNDGKVVVTSLLFPSPASDGLELYATDGDVKLIGLDIYELKSIWREDDERLTAPVSLDLSHGPLELPLGQSVPLSAVPFPRHVAIDDVRWTVSDPDVVTLEAEGARVLLRGVGEGEATVTAELATAGLHAETTVDVFERRFSSNLSDWRARGGTWTIRNGLLGTGTGDAFYLAGRLAKDFILEADVTFISGSAAALVFRANNDASQAYVANVDRARRDARVFKFPATGPFELGISRILVKDTYHLKVHAEGDRIRFYLDGRLLFDVRDAAYTEGYVGLNVFNASVRFDNVRFEDLSARQ